MDIEKQEQEVSLKRMLLSVLYRWKIILVVALALAVIMGGIQAWMSTSAANRNANQAALESYELEKNQLEKEVASLQGDVDYLRQYLNESVLMQLDYYDIHEAKVSLYIDSDYQILPGMEYQNTDDRGTMLNIYHAALTGDKILDEVAQTVGIETKYLKELVKITSSNERIISIYVWHTDSQTAQQIRDLLLKQMAVVGEWITEGIGEHKMNVVTESVGVVVNTEVSQLQQKAQEKLQDSIDALAEAKTKRNALAKPASSGAITDSIKWAAIGGISGAILVAVWSCCGFVFGDRVSSAEELKSRFDLKIIGGVWGGKKACDPITARLMAAQGRVFRNSEENLDLIAANIGSYAGGCKVILCSGAVQDMPFAEQLQSRMPDVKLLPCGSLTANAAAVRMLQECDGVLLVEKRGASRYSEITREIERINDAKKRLIGAVIVEN